MSAILKTGEIVVYIRDILQIPSLIKHHKTLNNFNLSLGDSLKLKMYDNIYNFNNNINIYLQCFSLL